MKIKSIIMLVLIALCGVAQAALVTFEDGDFGVAALDNKAITNNYLAGAGVSFSTGAYGATNYGSFTGSAYLEQMGQQAGESTAGGNMGFAYGAGTNAANLVDTVKPTDGGYDGLTATARSALMGNYFLRTTTYSRDSLAVQYSTAVAAASFEIWDLDGNGTDGERWKITTYNGNWLTPASSQETALILVNADDASYDGQCLNVVLAGGTFDRFVIEFTGTKTSNVGLAFNNFNTTAVPEPATFLLFGLGGMGAWLIRRKKAKSEEEMGF